MARPEIEPKTPLGRRLRAVRARFEIEDRDEFASRLGISKGALAYYERGERTPDGDVLAAYRKEFGVNINWLLTEAGDMIDDPSKAPSKAIQVQQSTAQQLAAAVQDIREVASDLSELRQAQYQEPRYRDPPYREPPPPPTIKYFPMRVSAGGGAVVLHEIEGVDMDIDRLASELLGIARRRIRLFKIEGDSMLPTLAQGDVVVVDAGQPAPGGDPLDEQVYVVSINGEIYAKRARWPALNTLHWCSDNDLPEYAPIAVFGEDFNNIRPLGRVVWVWRRV